MPTAVKKPSAAERVAGDAFAVYSAAEEILFNLPSVGVLTAVQREILRQAGFEGHDAIEAELGRIAAVKSWMQKAGTRAELLDAEKQMIETQKVYLDKSPVIEEQIAKLQAEIDALKRACDEPAKRFNEFTNAREHLRELVPKFVREAGDFDRGAAMMPYGRRMGEIRSQLDCIRTLQEIHAHTQEAELHFEAIGRARGVKAGARGVEPNMWRAYVEGRLAERPLLERELRELQSKCRSACEAIDDWEAFYIDQLETS